MDTSMLAQAILPSVDDPNAIPVWFWATAVSALTGMLVLTGGTTIYFVKQHFEAIKQQLHEVLAKVEELREEIRDHMAKTEGLERRVVTMELEQAKIEGRMERLELRATRSGHGG